MLMRGVDVVVATPGRLLDLLSRQCVSLHKLEHVVLDEVDRMLDMGFADDVERILQLRYQKGLQFLCLMVFLFNHKVKKNFV